MFRQPVENGGPAFRVARAGHEPARLVMEEEPRALPLGQRLAVDLDAVRRAHVEGRRGDLFAVDLDPAGKNPLLRLAARAQPRPCDPLGDALALLLALAARHGVTWCAE